MQVLMLSWTEAAEDKQEQKKQMYKKPSNITALRIL